MIVDWDDVLAASVDELASLLVAQEPLEAVLDRVVQSACASIPACDHASVTLMDERAPSTIVSTDPVAEMLDNAQYASDSGPCLYAFEHREPVSIPSLRADDRWPEFRAVALSHDVHSSLSLPLAAGTANVGALNLYSGGEHGFDTTPPREALLFASHAAAAVWSARAHAQARDVMRHLETALETREMIGMAKGIIMANERVHADDAFEILRTASQHRNRKLRDIADEVVATGETPRYPPA